METLTTKFDLKIDLKKGCGFIWQDTVWRGSRRLYMQIINGSGMKESLEHIIVTDGLVLTSSF